MSKKILLSAASCFILSGCLVTTPSFTPPSTPDSWSDYQNNIVQQDNVQALGQWWTQFNDPALNQIINLAMEDSPDRRIAQTRILEARGLRRSAVGALFPSLDATGSVGREDNGINDEDNVYQAGFDASYEIDILGQNRKTANAAQANIKSLEAQYHNVTLTLIAEIARDYTQYRAAQRQVQIAKSNLELQEKTLDLVRNLYEYGEVPKLDVEQAENLVNTTRSSIPEFERRAKNSALRLSVLTGNLPEKLDQFLNVEAPIPHTSIDPVLMAPADVIALRPDVRAAISSLEAAGSLTDAAIADLFPQFNVSGFFGIAENALTSSTTIWSVAIGTAVNLIDFGRIRGRIDTAKAIEMRAFEAYRKTVIEAVTEVETALNDYAKINEQYVHLTNAYDNAREALRLSQLLYREGEVSFLNVLDSQRNVNVADINLINVRSNKTQSLIRLYKSLGVY